MAKIHDKYVIELAEVIKGYGNDPDVEDPFELSLFYRFYELPNIAIHRENFLKMKPLETRKGKWIDMGDFEQCSACTGTHLKEVNTVYGKVIWIKSLFCPNCGADMREEVEGGDRNETVQ